MATVLFMVLTLAGTMAERDLYNLPLEPWEWWGCMEPERPYDPSIFWDDHCSACMVKARLVLTAEGDFVIFDETGIPKGHISDMVRRVAHA